MSIELGRLATRINQYRREDYPVARIGIRQGEEEIFAMDSWRSRFNGVLAEGEFVDRVYDSPEEELAGYAEEICREHAEFTDEEMRAAPSGPYHGYSRNRRWADEYDRRAL